MDRVTLLILGMLATGAVSGATPADAEPIAAADVLIDRWQPFIAEAARRFAIPESWIRTVMRAESGGRTRLDGRPITSAAGAMGLMQLMSQTYAAMRRRHGLGPDPHDPRDNVLAGAASLRALYDRYGHPGLFAAYHAGAARIDAYLAGGRPLPAATQRYLAALGVTLPQPETAPGRSLFFPLGGGAAAGAGGLFVTLGRDAEAPPDADSP